MPPNDARSDRRPRRRGRRPCVGALVATVGVLLGAACTGSEGGRAEAMSDQTVAPTPDATFSDPSTSGDATSGEAVSGEDAPTSTVEGDSATRYADPVFTQVESTQGVVFAEVEDPEGGVVPLSADVYEPAGDDADDRALIILFFGGGFVGGARDDLGMQALASLLTRHGYVVATPDYRTLGRSPAGADELQAAAERAVDDAALALRWFASDEASEQFGIDTGRTIVGGVSAGGIIAATLATEDATASEVAAALVISGALTDLDRIDAGDAPMFVVHEELDAVVPCEVGAEGSSDTGLVVAGGCALLERAAAVGLEADGWIIEGQSTHVGFSPDQFERLLDEATDFLAEQI